MTKMTKMQRIYSMMNRKTNAKPNDVLIYETVSHILNNLSDQGIKVWLDMGELMPNLKGGKYAATEKKPRKQYSKFGPKWDMDTEQVLALCNQ